MRPGRKTYTATVVGLGYNPGFWLEKRRYFVRPFATIILKDVINGNYVLQCSSELRYGRWFRKANLKPGDQIWFDARENDWDELTYPSKVTTTPLLPHSLPTPSSTLKGVAI